MQVPRPAELRVLEVVMLEISNRVRHVFFPGQKMLFPDRLPFSQHPAHSFQRLWNFTETQRRTKTAVTELRMSKPQIVLPLREVIRKFIAQGEPDPVRLSVRTD